MTLFKKKFTLPALYFSLDRELEYAKLRGLKHFYYSFRDYELDNANAWAIKNRVWIEPSHITDGNTWYKIYGF